MDRLNAIAETVSEETDLEVVKVLFLKVHQRRVLRITINKEGGVALSDCERFSRAFSAILDEADFIDEKYYLEVQSPGI